MNQSPLPHLTNPDGEEPGSDFSYSDHNNIAGEEAMTQSDFQKVFYTRDGRRMGRKSWLQYRGLLADRYAGPLSRKVEVLVSQFEVSPEVRSRISQQATSEACRLVKGGDLSADRAAVASVAQEFLRLGWDLASITKRISSIRPWVARTGSVEVMVRSKRGQKVRVLVDGIPRRHRSLVQGPSLWTLVIPLYLMDQGALLRLVGVDAVYQCQEEGFLIKERRASFRVSVQPRSFELFKLLKECCIDIGDSQVDRETATLVRRYSLDKLSRTSELLRGLGCHRAFNEVFVSLFLRKLSTEHGRTPRILAEEALRMADSAIVSSLDQESRDYARTLEAVRWAPQDARGGGLSSLVARGEISVWGEQ
jgi:hypothetical protein